MSRIQGEEFEFAVPLTAAGSRLDVFLSDFSVSVSGMDNLPQLSRSRAKALIEDKLIFVDGSLVRPAYILRGAEEIRGLIPQVQPLDLSPQDIPLNIIYEDSDIVVVNKSANLVVHPGVGREEITLVHGLLAHCDDLSGVGGVARPGIVHRLDKNTSGAIIVAKNDLSHRALVSHFSERRVSKTYNAFVFGVPEPPKGTIRTLYGRHPKDRKRFSGKVGRGKEAITNYRLLSSGGGLSSVEVDLATGRTHQIRVHLSEMGYPIVADTAYGGMRWMRIKDKELQEIAQNLGRQALHAAQLELPHPRSGEMMVFKAPLPPELQILAERINKL
ncbi:RluA family pseudouridine synthase [Myxococcota bacterium]|nr:RluA family pseudouridine synthase [Myxococcota bacterium]